VSLQAHLDDGQLLRLLDGELSTRQSKRARGHLEACWQCRAAAEDLEDAIANCVQYRKQVFQAHLPAPPAPWADLSEEFARIDSEVGAGSWLARLGNLLAAPPARRWAMTAAAVVILGAGLYYRLHETPSAQASALLKRAVAIASSRQAPARQIRIRTSVRNRAVIPAMFREAKYKAENPLSAKSFQDWREQAVGTQDTVATVPDPQAPGQSRYQIQTTAAEGDLAVASLTLRATDLRPVEGRFEFRNREWVEYEEISEASTTDGGTPDVTRLEVPMRQAVPSRSAALPSGSSASISEELRVIGALHEIGADLGDPVEVNLADGLVVVSGVGVTPERQREIRSALEGIPHVAVQFSNPGTPGASVADGAVDADSPSRSALQSRMEQQFGGRAEFERFSGLYLDQMESAMARVYAIRALAQRFPDGSQMADADSTRLRGLARQHLSVLTGQVNELHRALAPVLVSLGGRSAQGRPASGRSWQTATEDLFRSSRRLELLLSNLLGATREGGSANLPADVLAAFADVKVELDALELMLQ
jgi:hypothetical protein